VVPEEGAPLLAVAGDAPGQIALDGALGDADSDLEELTADSLGSPARVASGHLADETGVPARLAALGARAPTPEEAKARAVPSQHRRRLDQGHGRAPRRCAGRQAPDHPSLRRGEADALALEAALRRDQLLTQHLVLGDKRRA
jgi:hypothetical protein